MWTHFDGLRTKLLLMTFYDFFDTSFKKNVKSHVFFWNLKKRKIRILEHCRHPECFGSLRKPSNLSRLVLVNRPVSRDYSRGSCWKHNPSCWLWPDGATSYYKVDEVGVKRCVQIKTAMKCAENHANWLRRFEDVSSQTMVVVASFFGQPCKKVIVQHNRPIDLLGHWSDR